MYFDGILTDPTDRPSRSVTKCHARSRSLGWGGNRPKVGWERCFRGFRSALSSILKELGPEDIARYLFRARLLNFMQRDMGDG